MLGKDWNGLLCKMIHCNVLLNITVAAKFSFNLKKLGLTNQNKKFQVHMMLMAVKKLILMVKDKSGETTDKSDYLKWDLSTVFKFRIQFLF